MSKKISGVVALVGLCALSLFLLNCGSSSSRPSGILYVLTQGTTVEGTPALGSNVSSFAIDFNNGGLSLINSNASACPTQATSENTNPCGLPLDILLDPTGATAFVLDQGVPCVPQEQVAQCVPSLNTPTPPAIYPYTVNSDGSLSAPGSPEYWTCPSGSSPCTQNNSYPDTALAMVRDAAGQFLFVIDEGSEPTLSNQYLSNCPQAPTSQTDVCPSITVFTMQSGSGSTSLTLASGSPLYLSKIPSALSAITFTPPGGTGQELLFVTSNHDLNTAEGDDNTVDVYAVDPSGTLTEPNPPYIISAIDPISVLAVNTLPAGETTTGGLFVYVGNQDSSGGHLYPFQVCTVVGIAGCTQQDVNSNLMFPLATCGAQSCEVPPTSAGSNPVGMLVDPTSSFLYVVSEISSQVFGFRIDPIAGKLTALSPPNYPTGSGSQPGAMALHASVNANGQSLYSESGQFLYVSNSGSSNIVGLTLNTTSGTMSNPITVIAPSSPSGMATH